MSQRTNAGASMSDPAAELVRRLQAAGVDPSPTGPDTWDSRCPGHEGSRRNLSIGRGDDGHALIYCHHEQSCSPEAICQALGMTVGDLFPARLGPPEPTGNRGGRRTPRHRQPKGRAHSDWRDAIEPVARQLKAMERLFWTYHESAGNPIAFVFRLNYRDPKSGGLAKTYRPVSRWPDG